MQEHSDTDGVPSCRDVARCRCPGLYYRPFAPHTRGDVCALRESLDLSTRWALFAHISFFISEPGFFFFFSFLRLSFRMNPLAFKTSSFINLKMSPLCSLS